MIANAQTSHYQTFIKQNPLLFFSCIGLAYLFSGLFFMPSGGQYRTLAYVLFLLPTTLFLIKNHQLIFHSVQKSFFWSFLAFIFYTGINIIWADNIPDDSTVDIFRYAAQIFLFGLFSSYLYQMHVILFKRILNLAIVACAFFASVRLIHFYGIQEHNLYERLTGFGLLEHPVIGMSYLGVFQIIILIEIFTVKTTVARKFILVLASIPILSAITMTQSRTILAGLLMGIIVIFAIASILQPSRKKILIASIALVLISAYAYLFQDTITKRGLSLRPGLITNTIIEGMEKPWFGHGYGSDTIIPSNEQALAESLNKAELREQAALYALLYEKRLVIEKQVDELKAKLPKTERGTIERKVLRKKLKSLKNEIYKLMEQQRSLPVRNFSTPHNTHVLIFYFGGISGFILFSILTGISFFYAFKKIKQHDDFLPLILLVYGNTILLSMSHAYVSPPNVMWFYLWMPLFLAASQPPTSESQAHQA